ncbi:MAG: DJ-1/PfpI family protein [Chitinophagaceae bacterium]|nr:DJ-1/PfpI family protein [Chitinophagaceae bacterium]
MNKCTVLIIFFAISIACNNKKDIENSIPSHDPVTKNMLPKPKVDIKTVGILLYDGFTTMDAMGPYQVLSELMGVKVFFVGRHKGLVSNTNGMKIQCDTSIAEVKHLDILVIPGGFKETYKATRDMELLDRIKQIDSTSTYTASVCTGAWILGATGLLKDKEATTHWYGKKILADEFGAIIQDKRFVKTGKYWTSAGVTAGMDMSLALVNEIMGEKYTQAVMLDIEYNPKPPISGGSEQNTDKDIVEGIRTMYDGAMQSVLHPEKAFENLKFNNAKDFVCGMPVKAGVSDTVHYKGKVFGFCSKECKDEFLKTPSNYLSKK